MMEYQRRGAESKSSGGQRRDDTFKESGLRGLMKQQLTLGWKERFVGQLNKIGLPSTAEHTAGSLPG